MAQNLALQESVKALTETVKAQQEQINQLTLNLQLALERFNGEQPLTPKKQKQEPATLSKALKPTFIVRNAGKAAKLNRIPIPSNRSTYLLQDMIADPLLDENPWAVVRKHNKNAKGPKS